MFRTTTGAQRLRRNGFGGLAAMLLLALASSAAIASPASAVEQNDGARAPDMESGNVRLVRVRFIPAGETDGEASIMDASGCNQNVCIVLTGTGTYLSKWRTTASVTSATCSYARFHRNDSVIRTSATICSSGSGTLEAIWESPGYFTDGDKLCNSWNGISGYPCKYIEA